MSGMRQGLGLVVIIMLTFAAAGLGGLFTPGGGGDWYERPSWAPPDWVFGPVWTLLYTLMALAAWLVWRRAGFAAAHGALGAYIVQLALNASWTPVFFGLRMPGAAFALIIALWIAIIITVVLFAQHSAAAAWLLSPYLAWVTFAAALNLRIWQLTP